MIGRTISHYKIIEKIGEGGMGEVYLAEDTNLQRKVAIKFLPKHLSGNENIQRFKREAQAAATLNHPNIVTIHEIAEHDDQTFIVMEYVEGKSLRDVINESQLGTDKVIDIISQISEGLQEAHKSGIVHRDIKPENIIVGRDGRVRILDFGLAKLKGVSKLTADSSTLGTVQYMSPEQIQGNEVDHRSDIWSLGVVSYELLSGEPPFKGDYESAVHYAILNDEPEKIRTDAPERLVKIVNKCLRKNPADRYIGMANLIDDLKDDGIESSDINTVNKKPKRRKRTIPILVSALVVVLVVVGYLLMPLFVSDKSSQSSFGWENSIAVLPLDDLSPEGDQEWLSNGMTDQIISNIGRLSRIKVIPYQSMKKYKNTDKSVSEIGSELNVVNVLVGSIQKFDKHIKITLNLIKTENEVQVWSEHYNGEYKAVFDIQDGILEAIGTNLLATLSPQEKKSIITNRPSNTEAYEYYMKGRYFHYNKYSSSQDEKDYLTSEKMFKQAIKLDPNFADSYASLADLYNSFFNNLPDTSSDKSTYMQLQEAYLDTAYQLDPNSAEVNYAKGCIHISKNEDEKGFNSFKTAIKINPNNEQYYSNLGFFLFKKGCNNLAIKCFNKAVELNPLNAGYYGYRGTLYWEIGEYDKAESSYKKALELNPSSSGQILIWLLFLESKRYVEANELLPQIKINYPDEDFSAVAVEAMQYAIDGEREKALNILKSKGKDFPFFYKCVLLAQLKLKDDLINELQKYYDPDNSTERNRYLSLKNNPSFDFIRSDPRFQKILAQRKEQYEENLAKYGDIEEILN